MRHLFLLGLAGCGGVGACISDVVDDFQYLGDRVYCYDGWDRFDCDVNTAEEVNGVAWTFHPGDTCDDHGLSEGSNAAR